MRTLYIEPGSPWENGYVESFNGKLRDELLNVESFETLKEAQVLVERWRREYNQRRPHSALDYRPPAPEARFPENPSPGAGSPEWTAKGPVSNVARGLVNGGRSGVKTGRRGPPDFGGSSGRPACLASGQGVLLGGPSGPQRCAVRPSGPDRLFNPHVLQKRLVKPLVTLYSGDRRPESDGPFGDENQHFKRIFSGARPPKTTGPRFVITRYYPQKLPLQLFEILIIESDGKGGRV